MCGCGRTQQQFQVRLPDGEIKVYSSEIAANAKVKSVAGAEHVKPVGASV